MIFQKGDSVALAVQNPISIPQPCWSVRVHLIVSLKVKKRYKFNSIYIFRFTSSRCIQLDNLTLLPSSHCVQLLPESADAA